MHGSPFRLSLVITCTLSLAMADLLAQEGGGQVHGNFNMDSQYYQEDTLIGAQKPPQTLGLNSWTNLNYSSGNFKAGVRFESYERALLGYPAGQPYVGSGLGYRYATYTKDDLDVTVGNFYEQFGQGLAFRSYEERNLGVDNAMDGIRVKFRPDTGIYLKGFIGKQRLGFDGPQYKGYFNGKGLVRGIDAEVSLTEAWPRLFPKMLEKGHNLTLGGSFVSKYEESQVVLVPGDTAGRTLELPLNVGTFAARINYTTARWNWYAEYAHKINDPNGSNNFVYKDGQALLVNATYSTRGLGISAGAHTYDNMVFQSERSSPSLFNLNINYLPTFAKQHTYNLPATLYPYATQPNGEVAYQAEVFYKFKKGTKLGGAHGTKLAVNWSAAWGLDSTHIANDTLSFDGYRTHFFANGKRNYFQDFNIELRKKVTDTWELAATYINFVFDIEQIQGKAGKPVVYTDMVVIEGLHNFTDRNSLRFELQHLRTKQQHGNWATAVAELTFSPHWFVAAMDQYNYGSDIEAERIHYPIASVGYIRGGSRFSMNYGRQRAGIFCVGGVCRVVPASNGLTLSITSTF
jgi:Family of unknown function (DUF6029)